MDQHEERPAVPYVPGPNPGQPEPPASPQQHQVPAQQPPYPPQHQPNYPPQHQPQHPMQHQPNQHQPNQHQQVQPYQPQPYQPQPQWQGAPAQYPAQHPAQYPAQFPGMQPMVKPRNPGVAAVLSFLWPGVGQIMNGDIGIGILMMVLVVIAWLSLMILIGIVLLPAIYIWSIVDAYTKAKRWNQAHGIIS